MKFSDIIKTIGLVLVFLIFFVAMLACLYHEGNIEYKYTAKVNCYDKHDSMIENTMCEHEIYCGPWQDSTPFRRGSLPCDRDALVEVDE